MRAVTRLLVAGALTLGSGCASSDWIDRTLMTETVGGEWAGTMVSQDGQPSVSQAVRLELQQKGPKVTGYVRGVGVGSRLTTIEGSIAGDVFKFSDERGTLTGELTVNGDEMRGQGEGAEELC